MFPEEVRVIQFTISLNVIIALLLIIFLLSFVIIKTKTNKTMVSGDNYRRVSSKLIIIIEGLPLLIYPFVLLANVMQLASLGNGDPRLIPVVFMILFLLLSSAYPITYFLCFWFVFKRVSKFKLWISLIPGLHILLTVLLFNFNLFLEQKFLG